MSDPNLPHKMRCKVGKRLRHVPDLALHALYRGVQSEQSECINHNHDWVMGLA